MFILVILVLFEIAGGITGYVMRNKVFNSIQQQPLDWHFLYWDHILYLLYSYVCIISCV